MYDPIGCFWYQAWVFVERYARKRPMYLRDFCSVSEVVARVSRLHPARLFASMCRNRLCTKMTL